MSQATDALENLILDQLFRAQVWPKVAALHVALFTSAPSDTGGGTEVSGGAYARVSIASDDTHWTSTQGGTSGPSSGTTGTTTNVAPIVFPAPTGDWGLVTHFGIFDAPTNGVLLMWAPLDAPRRVLDGDGAPSFPAGLIRITIGDPASPTGAGAVVFTATSTATGQSAIGGSATVTLRVPTTTASVTLTGVTATTGSVAVSAPGLAGVALFSEEETVTVFTSTANGVQNNFNVGDLTAQNLIRMNNVLPTTITGLTDNGSTPTDGQMVWIVNVGSSRVDIAALSAGSSAAYKILTGVSAPFISLAAGGRALLYYDAVFPVWRVIVHEQGAWIDIPYNAADFTGGGSMVVTAQQPVTYRYRLSGRTMSFELQVNNFSISGTPSQLIQMTMFGSFIAAAQSVQTPCVVHDNGNHKNGRLSLGQSVNAGTKIVFMLDGVVSWAPSTNQTGMDCAITFDVQ